MYVAEYSSSGDDISHGWDGAQRSPLLAFVKTARRIPQTRDRFLGVGGWGNARAGSAVCFWSRHSSRSRKSSTGKSRSVRASTAAGAWARVCPLSPCRSAKLLQQTDIDGVTFFTADLDGAALATLAYLQQEARA